MVALLGASKDGLSAEELDRVHQLIERERRKSQ
jgi:hypothetical protein